MLLKVWSCHTFGKKCWLFHHWKGSLVLSCLPRAWTTVTCFFFVAHCLVEQLSNGHWDTLDSLVTQHKNKESLNQKWLCGLIWKGWATPRNQIWMGAIEGEGSEQSFFGDCAMSESSGQFFMGLFCPKPKGKWRSVKTESQKVRLVIRHPQATVMFLCFPKLPQMPKGKRKQLIRRYHWGDEWIN